MKRLISLFAAILFALQAFAQINLQDSTVQVVGYWDKGDKYNYELKWSQYETNGSDTTWTRRSKDIFTIEIIDSTDTGYLLKCSFIESMSLSENKEIHEIAKKIEKLSQNIPIILQTDIYGTFKGLWNYKEYQAELMNAVDLIKKEMKNGKDDEIVDKTFASLANVINSESFVYRTIEPITSLLAFHGGKYSMGKEYSEDHKLASPIDPATLIDAKNVFGVYKYDTESSVAIFVDEWIYNEDQITANALALINKLLPDGEKLEGLLDDQKITLSVIKQVNIHTDSGWPTYGFRLQETASQGKTKTEEWEVSIILE